MKILAFTDTHMSTVAEKKIVEKARKDKPDIMLCCGDFTVFMHDAHKFLKRINSLNITTYLIHGNHEHEHMIADMCKKHKNIKFIHKKAIEHKDLLIMGYGGDGFSVSDPMFKFTARSFEQIIMKKKKHKKILMLHQPPHNSGIDIIYGDFAGNKTTKRFIEKHKIHLVLAGHLHENSGKMHEHKGTKYINPGPNGMIIEI